MTTILNTTPHSVSLLNSNNEVVRVFEKSNISIRLSVKTEVGEPVGDIPTTKTVFGEPEGLPNFNKDTFYIVSQLVKSACPDRTDLLVPAEVVRDQSGVIIGCRSLGR